jgi:RNase P subunit RPR2
MKRQYLHLSAYVCDECAGPVIAGLTAVRENEISKEADLREVGAICLSCRDWRRRVSFANARGSFANANRQCSARSRPRSARY